jgi:hypothetical protein
MRVEENINKAQRSTVGYLGYDIVAIYKGKEKMRKKIEAFHFEVEHALHTISWMQVGRKGRSC